jgi:hypothetical protein
MMATTIIYDDRAFEAASATTQGDDVWLSEADLFAATGWERKPQGLCRGERCVPIPPGRTDEFVASDGRFNLAAFARYLDAPVVHDDAASVWLVGEAAETRRDALRSLDAPDFELPDLDGRLHALSGYRGKKVLLLTWASW